MLPVFLKIPEYSCDLPMDRPPGSKGTEMIHARAHNSLWLHTEVSSKNNLMIPLSLGGGPKENWQVLEYPGASIHPDVCLSCHLR